MTAYEMRISDWSSDVCSSDLPVLGEITLGSGRRAAGIRHVRGGVAAEERTQLVVVGDRGQRSEIEIIVDLDQSIDHPFAEGALHVGYERHVGIVRIQGGSREIPKRQDRKSTRLNSSH